jgi:hypothetical protein
VFHYTSLFDNQRDMIALQRVAFINLFFATSLLGKERNRMRKIASGRMGKID